MYKRQLLLCGGLALDVGHEEGGDEGRDKGGNGFDDGRDVDVYKRQDGL